jgi:four helix bundle protein
MTEYPSQADKIQSRLVDLAIAIVHLAAHLPRTPAGQHVAAQILRSGTSPAPNYGEARGAESKADFVHKLRVALKELNETAIWLQIIRRSRMNQLELDGLIKENQELSRILVSSIKTIKTASRNDK